jgi:site-specific recombinase XerD
MISSNWLGALPSSLTMDGGQIMVPKEQEKSTQCHSLLDLMEAAHSQLLELGYSRYTAQNYRAVWKRMARFGKTNVFSQELGNSFLLSLGVYIDRLGRTQVKTPYQREACCALRILNEFVAQGYWHRRRITRIIELPDEFEAILKGYEDHFIELVGGSRRTLTTRVFYLRKLLEFLKPRIGITLSELKPFHLTDFVAANRSWSPATIATRINGLRSFCRYLFASGILSHDISSRLPRPRIPKDQKIPMVWTQQDVESILQAVDRSSAKGKRDYAILLLACRLGMRSEDIRRLSLDHVCWTSAQIVMCQSKTKRALALPLLDEIGSAIVDYLRHARPVSEYREIFLRLTAPIAPFANNTALYNMMNHYRRLAGVVVSPDASHGLHSFRHTLATRLVKSNTPFSTISQVLGHTSINSTRIYAKVDIGSLRSAALDPEEVSHA